MYTLIEECSTSFKHASAGYVFTRIITDDTQPDGPEECTIEYVVPFYRFNREQYYENAREFFREV